MTDEQLIQRSFPYLIYADEFSYTCCESSASTSPAPFSFVKMSLLFGSTGASFTASFRLSLESLLIELLSQNLRLFL